MSKTIAIIGGGPSGLMAAEVLSAKGFNVSIYERKPSVGRKFLMAGRGGLNLTHSEDLKPFLSRYGERSDRLKPMINQFPPQALRAWCESLGQPTFIGSSKRVFPQSFKASPLLRAWIARLKEQGVDFMLNYEWRGWKEGALVFSTTGEDASVTPDATILALGGASWPRLGSDGGWVDVLKAQNIEIALLRPANCGFYVDWSPVFSARFAGTPLKAAALSFNDQSVRGEFVMTDKGIEGSAVYALGALLREEIARSGSAQLIIDLKPDLDANEIQKRLQRPRAGLSLTNYLRKTLKLPDVAIGLLMEKLDRTKLSAYTPAQLTRAIKFYALDLNGIFSIDRAISTAGGVTFDAIDDNAMLVNKEGVFIAGEMLDWEAPTGGYLLQASLSSGVCAANGVMRWLNS